MRFIYIILILLVILQGCEKTNEETTDHFPECVGIEGSFNPQNISKSFSGKFWNSDTIINTKFVFTDYVNYYAILRAEKSWNMWVKFTTGSTSYIYQNFYCYYSFVDERWYAWTGMDLNGTYTSWDLNFETFNCSEFTGKCDVTFQDGQDTVHYQFEGRR